MSPLSDTLSVVDESLSAAAAGMPTVLLIEGPPGSGKTTLLARSRSRLHRVTLSVSSGEKPSAGADVVVDRERDVLALLVKGLSYAQIAGELFVARSAVAFHLSNIYAKFDVRSRHDLTAYLLTHPQALAR